MPSLVQLRRTPTMDLLHQPNMPHSQDFSSDKSSLVEGIISPDVKVPKEFTAQGTTPSGKPRLFECEMCTRAFARLEHLRRHERSHTKEKPFDCGVCQRKFSRRDLLLRHAQKLHAGCDDAVARMRRRLSKSHSISSGLYDAEFALGPSPSVRSTSSSARPDSLKRASFQGSLVDSLDSVNFNLNSSSGISGSSKDSPRSPAMPTSKPARSNSVKSTELKKQIYEKRKTQFRRASFSAQSGQNYSMVPPQQYDPSSAENGEFSTPQFLPTFASDEESWLSTLCTIPGMSSLKTQQTINEETQAYSFEHEFPKNMAMFGGGVHPDLMRSESIGSSSSVSNINTPGTNPPFTPHRSNFAGNTPCGKLEGNFHIKAEADQTGYSFYDIPESYAKCTIPTSGVARPLSPIRQEYEDELMDLDTSDQFLMKAMPVPIHYNRNHLHDLEELDRCFDIVGKNTMSGYSFYGDNALLPSTGIESMSSQASASPTNVQAADPQLLAKASFLNGPRYDSASRVLLEDQLEHDRLFEQGYSRSTLFTGSIRFMIMKALRKYPISDVITPVIPTNEKMEFYKSTFIDKFLSYFPFVHPSKLNEFEVMDMTSDEDPQNESARVCLPLLVVTFGALLANNKTDLDQLYEASRRTVHIYLESRKNGDKANPPNGQQTNPLWLIQSLTLSVMYSLFSDNENNIHIVIRQLNALNSLVKTSLKSNTEIFFAVTGQDEVINNFAIKEDWRSACEALNCSIENELKFKHSIALQSQVRSALTIYQLTNFVLMMFNVPLTLSATELGSLTCPNVHDEFLWGFNNHSEFANHLQTMGVQKDISFFLSKDESNSIIFQDVLKRLCQSQADESILSKLINLSKFGFNCLVKGVYELMQYEDYNFVDTGVVLDYLTGFVNSPSRDPQMAYMTFGQNINEKFDYALLVNFVKICSKIDFKMVKEQSWLKNFDVLNKNFHLFLNSMDSIDDVDYLKVIDHCIIVTKLVVFKIEDAQTSIGGDNGNSHSHEGELLMKGDSSGALNNSGKEFERAFGLRVQDKISCAISPMHSQVLFHVFVIFSIFAVYVAKRNNPITHVAQSHNDNDTWQLNHKFIEVLKMLARFEDHLKVQFENHQLDVEMTNLFLLLSGSNKNSFLENQCETNNVLAYNLEKALYVLTVGELMMRSLYEQNIKVIMLKKLSGSMSQIRKYLIDEESTILP